MNRKIPVLAPVLGVMLLLLFVAGSVFPVGGLTHAAAEAWAGGYYVGRIGTKLPVQMELLTDGAEVSGRYYYEAYGVWIPLKGKLAGGVMKLSEYAPEGAGQGGTDAAHGVQAWEYSEGARCIGTFTGPFTGSGGGSWNGTWRSADGKRSLPFTLHRVAEFVRSEKHADRYTLSALYPRFIGQFPAAGQINAAIQDEVRKKQAGMESMIKDSPPLDSPKAKEYRYPWEQDLVWHVSYYSADLVSLYGMVFEYTGGAHPNTDYYSLNFWTKDGNAVPFGLSRLFKAGSAYLSMLSRHTIASLRKQGASSITSGLVTRFTADDLKTFVLSPVSITFIFSPYAVGSYAEGSYTVTIPYSVLRDDIDPAGPIAGR